MTTDHLLDLEFWKHVSIPFVAAVLDAMLKRRMARHIAWLSTASVMVMGDAKSCPILANALVSFGKHEPP